MVEIVGHSQTKGRDNREPKLRPKPAHQSSTLPMSEVWKRSHGRTNKAPPDERGGNRYVRPKATAPHLDSTIHDFIGPPRHVQNSPEIDMKSRPFRCRGMNGSSRQRWLGFLVRAAHHDLWLSQTMRWRRQPGSAAGKRERSLETG